MRNIQIVITAVLALIILAACAGTKEDVRRPPRERWDLVTLQAEVVDIVPDQRLVTLMGPSGNLVTIKAGDSVRRFDEISVGDMVRAEYWKYLVAEFRDPTPEEKEEPLVILADGSKAATDLPPGVAIGAIVKAVVTIVNINTPFREVTVQGPNGNYVSVSDVDPGLIKELKLGEVGILTYAEAVALTLEKMN